MQGFLGSQGRVQEICTTILLYKGGGGKGVGVRHYYLQRHLRQVDSSRPKAATICRGPVRSPPKSMSECRAKASKKSKLWSIYKL